MVIHIVLVNTRWGIYTVATGGNPVGAREAGIQTKRIKVGNFVLAAMLAGFMGISEAIRVTSMEPLAGGSQLMFLGVAAAVIGGTALAGGSGTVVGAFLGALVLGVLRDGLTIKGINAATFNMILGIAIIASMFLNARPTAPHPNEEVHVTDDAIRAEGVAKHFGPVVALRDVSIRLGRGEILGLIGDNGAGKSTLIKILTGFHQPDAGQIYLDGEPVTLRSVSDARQRGIETVYQDLALINDLPVFLNMSLKRELTLGRTPLLDKRAMRNGHGAAVGDGDQDPVDRHRRRAAVRRTTPGDRRRQGGVLRCQGDPARRTAGGDGRQGEPRHPRPHPRAQAAR